MCLILAAVGNIHDVQTRVTSFQELTKKEGRSLRKESTTAKARQPCELTFPETAVTVTGQLQAPETRARRLASRRKPRTSQMFSPELSGAWAWGRCPAGRRDAASVGAGLTVTGRTVLLESLCGAGTWPRSSSLFTEDQQVAAHFSYGD